MEGAEKRLPVYAAAKGGKRLHVGLQEFSEDVSASLSAGAAKAHHVLFNSFTSLKLAASVVGNAVTIKRVENRVEEEGTCRFCYLLQCLNCIGVRTENVHLEGLLGVLPPH